MSKEVKEKIRKVFLEHLPRMNKDKYSIGNCIDWLGSIGYKIRFIYDDIEGEVEIISYEKEKHYLEIKYLDKPIFKILSGGFTNCRLGSLLGKKTNKFKIEVGAILKDERRNMTITDTEIRKNKSGQSYKYYKYKCNKCGFECGEHYKNQEYREELWVVEDSLIRGGGCVCCNNKIVVVGINDIPTTTPWMIPYFQGGYEEAKMYTCSSNKEIYPICPECGRIKDKPKSINKININNSIGCNCSDKIPYGEKTMFNILEQLKIDFTTQLSTRTFGWCDKYKYDFYIPSLNIIIETHGIQHYEKGFDSCGGETTEEVQENDRVKKELALSNGIKEEDYIIIDCRYSSLELIKNSVLNSRVSSLFELSTIDWSEVQKFAVSSLVKVACEYWDRGECSIKEISVIMKLHIETIRRYLKQGNGMWCNYNAKEGLLKRRPSKQVTIFKDGIALGKFVSGLDLEKKSEELFGIKLCRSSISRVAYNTSKQYKGYTFQYTTPTSTNL